MLRVGPPDAKAEARRPTQEQEPPVLEPWVPTLHSGQVSASDGDPYKPPSSRQQTSWLSAVCSLPCGGPRSCHRGHAEVSVTFAQEIRAALSSPGSQGLQDHGTLLSRQEKSGEREGPQRGLEGCSWTAPATPSPGAQPGPRDQLRDPAGCRPSQAWLLNRALDTAPPHAQGGRTEDDVRMEDDVREMLGGWQTVKITAIIFIDSILKYILKL